MVLGVFGQNGVHVWKTAQGPDTGHVMTLLLNTLDFHVKAMTMKMKSVGETIVVQVKTFIPYYERI